MNGAFAKALIIECEITWQGSLFVGNFIISNLFDFEGKDGEEKYNSLLLFMAHLDLQTSQNHYQHLKTLSQKIYQL